MDNSMMGLLYIVCISLWSILLCDTTSIQEVNDNSEIETLSRQKRYLMFPEGTIMQLGYCLTIRSIIPQGVFAIGFTFGVNWNLPTDPISLKLKRSAEVVHRIDRRDLYNKLASVLQVLGVDGRSCVYKALCESGQRPIGAKGSFIEEIAHTVFRLPSGSNFDNDLEKYDSAHKTKRDCAVMFPSCSTTIHELFEIK